MSAGHSLHVFVNGQYQGKLTISEISHQYVCILLSIWFYHNNVNDFRHFLWVIGATTTNIQQEGPFESWFEQNFFT